MRGAGQGLPGGLRVRDLPGRARALRALERPRLIGGALILVGYLQAALRGSERYDEPGFRRSLRE